MKYKDSFTTIPDWLYYDDRIEGLSELIIAAIINGFSHDDQGQFHGSIEYLARKIKAKRRAVQRILRKLQSQGVIICDGIHQQYKTNIYRYIPISEDLKRHRVIMTPPCHKDAPEGVIKTPNSIVDNIERKKEKKIVKESLPIKSKFPVFEEYIKDTPQETLDLFYHWEAYKKEQFGTTYLDIGRKTAIKNLAELAGNNLVKAKKIVDQSIIAGWKGLFELKENGKAKPKEEMTLTERWERTSYE